MPVKPSASPSVKVSPIWMVPWLCRPMMSPAKASSRCSRSLEKKVRASAIFRSFLIRTWRSFMPFSYLPEQMRMKAMRSRCLGSMFAWILNTKPENFSSTGSTVRSWAARDSGRGAQSTTASSTWSTPKLPRAVGAEEHRGHFAAQEGVVIEFVAGTLDQLQFLDESLVEIAQVSAGLVGIQLVDGLGGDALVTMAGGIDVDAVVREVVDALEVAIAADRPGDGRGLDLEHRLDLVEQLDGVADITVELVDEADNGSVAQPADIHQGDGPGLHALAAVEHHQRRVHRGQGAVGVFGEVLVAGGYRAG
ncbi:hypothetical protein Q3H58_002009 [Pseudomonas psychrotolerans]|nr:hypothetical protein [Pseudomonas psychrotolerans]